VRLRPASGPIRFLGASKTINKQPVEFRNPRRRREKNRKAYGNAPNFSHAHSALIEKPGGQLDGFGMPQYGIAVLRHRSRGAALYLFQRFAIVRITAPQLHDVNVTMRAKAPEIGETGPRQFLVRRSPGAEIAPTTLLTPLIRCWRLVTLYPSIEIRVSPFVPLKHIASK